MDNNHYGGASFNRQMQFTSWMFIGISLYKINLFLKQSLCQFVYWAMVLQ